MNQDHLQQQPAADKYVIGGPSEFAEDLSNEGPGWKADLGSDGNTKRNEIGLPEFRKDTFDTPEHAPGVSPSRQASRDEVYERAQIATKVARLMLPKSASEQVIEDQAVTLMDLPLSSLNNTLSRLAEEQQEEDEDEDDGQQKQAADDEDDKDDDDGQQKQAGLPPEFLEQQKKMKEKSEKKDDGGGKSEKKDEKKEASSRRRAQQQDADDEDEDEGQQKQARRVKAQGQDDEKKQAQGDQDEKKGQDKEARRRKAQQQDDEAEGQEKKAQQQDEDDGDQKKEAADQDDEDGEKQVGKEAYALIKQAASDLLKMPAIARAATFKVVLPSLARAASLGQQQMLGQQQQVAQEQLQAQVQQLVQQAMQQQQGQQQQGQQKQQGQQQLQSQQQSLADEDLVDQMLQDPGQLSEEGIQMDAPDMDLGLYAGEAEDPALQAIFASEPEVQRALEARAIERGGHTPTASVRTASTRTVGTRPSSGVSVLGGGTASGAVSNVEEIDKLSRMWSSAPDVSSVFGS